jgi:hypothetical protein
MASFFKSFFLAKTETPEEAKAKNEKKNFDILKFDGLLKGAKRNVTAK